MNIDNNCCYCTKDQRLNDLMIEVCQLNTSILYLFREQTYKGKCILALKGHKRELFELDQNELEMYAKDIAKAASAIKKAFSPDKINYAVYGDKVSHLHVHLVPKYEGGPEWGEAFKMSPADQVFLSSKEYQAMIELLKANL